MMTARTLTARTEDKASDRWSLPRAISTLDGFIMGTSTRNEAERALSYLHRDFMRVGDAQAVLGAKSPTTIKKWIELGRFPGAHQGEGGHWLLPVSEVYELRDASVEAALANRHPAPTSFVARRGRRDPLAELDL
jgi:hypothetical protein